MMMILYSSLYGSLFICKMHREIRYLRSISVKFRSFSGCLDVILNKMSLLQSGPWPISFAKCFRSKTNQDDMSRSRVKDCVSVCINTVFYFLFFCMDSIVMGLNQWWIATVSPWIRWIGSSTGGRLCPSAWTLLRMHASMQVPASEPVATGLNSSLSTIVNCGFVTSSQLKWHLFLVLDHKQVM